MLLLLLRPYGGAAPAAVVVDTHDGDDERHDRLYRQKRERLREQIRAAIEGPMPESTPEVVREVIAEQAVKPSISDYRHVLDEVLARIEVYEEIERDDEEVMLLIH